MNEELNSDKEKILQAVGGKKGLLDVGLPALLFLVVFNLTKDIERAIYLALALSAILALIRLIQRQTVQHAISGLLGTLLAAWLVSRSGQAEDFFLPGLWTNAIYGIAYALSAVAGWPVIGLLIGPLIGENLRWRKDPARKRLYQRATWLWVAMFALRLLVQYPLYRSGNVNALGIARLAMGYPLFILTAWGTWILIKSSPKLLPEEREI
jgi:hypothetical protein